MSASLHFTPVLITSLLLSGCFAEKKSLPAESPSVSYVGADVCAGCHDSEYQRWRNSHHDLAMQKPSEVSVLGDFDTATFAYGDVESSFYRRESKFFVSTDGPDGELTEYEIAYTYGVHPLQQYLIEFPDGRLQALSIAWDSRGAAEGGQRWFHLYPDETINYADALHWTGPLQNWNFMCAECHSTNLQKNYDADNDTFATSWSEIDVACEACHGPGSTHAEQANAGTVSRWEAENTMLSFRQNASWLVNAATGTASREPARQSNIELETCARCHSRRSIQSEDYEHGAPLMNTHQPALLTEPLYYPDGQILDEVYVYGSFMQSAMHQAGVTCTDCHDAHSLQLKATDNSLCAQCHLPSVFDVQAHHRHEPDSAGAQCINCHMPSRNYMVVDGRRDHSFRIPRPDVSARIGSPNACNACHDDRDAEWAATQIEDWYGGEDTRHYGDIIYAGRRREAGASASLISLADDDSSPAIVRATAIDLLASNMGPGSDEALRRASRAPDPLVRIAAASAVSGFDPAIQVDIVAPLLMDPVRAVRLQAAGTLMHVPRTQMLQAQGDVLDAALVEYRAAQWLNADRAESRINLGVLNTVLGDRAAALAEYARALEIMPGFVAPYINIADLHREAGQEADVESTLRLGLSESPNNPELHHALGLSLVRQVNYEGAIDSLRKAYELDPDQVRYAYVLGIALNSTGSPDEALTVLKQAHQRAPQDRDLLVAIATMSRDNNQTEQALEFARRLLALTPADPLARQLAEELQR